MSRVLSWGLGFREVWGLEFRVLSWDKGPTSVMSIFLMTGPWQSKVGIRQDFKFCFGFWEFRGLRGLEFQTLRFRGLRVCGFRVYLDSPATFSYTLNIHYPKGSIKGHLGGPGRVLGCSV